VLLLAGYNLGAVLITVSPDALTVIVSVKPAVGAIVVGPELT
jgi:hypothetical protein